MLKGKKESIIFVHRQNILWKNLLFKGFSNKGYFRIYNNNKYSFYKNKKKFRYKLLKIKVRKVFIGRWFRKKHKSVN